MFKLSGIKKFWMTHKADGCSKINTLFNKALNIDYPDNMRTFHHLKTDELIDLFQTTRDILQEKAFENTLKQKSNN